MGNLCCVVSSETVSRNSSGMAEYVWVKYVTPHWSPKIVLRLRTAEMIKGKAIDDFFVYAFMKKNVAVNFQSNL